MANIGPNSGNTNPYYKPSGSQGLPQAGNSQNINSPHTQNVQNSPQALLTQAAQQLLGELLLAPLLQYQAQGMSPQEVRLFFRNLLQLPQELQQLFALLATGKEGQEMKSLLALMKTMPDVPMKELQEILQKAINQGEGKMMEILQSTQMAKSANSNLMGEMMNTMSQLGIQVASSPVEALTTTLMLYLPWYPITANQRLTLHFEAPKSEKNTQSEQSAQGDEAHLVMLLETKNLGNARIVLAPVSWNNILVSVQGASGILSLKDDVEAEVTQKLQGDDIPAPEYIWAGFEGRKNMVANTPVKQVGSDLTVSENEPTEKGKKRTEEPQMAVHAVGNVPILVINTAYLIARTIFRLDQVVEETLL